MYTRIHNSLKVKVILILMILFSILIILIFFSILIILNYYFFSIFIIFNFNIIGLSSFTSELSKYCYIFIA